MKFIELWMKQHKAIHPEDSAQLTIGLRCPSHFGYEEPWDCVEAGMKCPDCWKRDLEGYKK